MYDRVTGDGKQAGITVAVNIYSKQRLVLKKNMMGKQAANYLWQVDIDFYSSGNWNSPCFLTRQSLNCTIPNQMLKSYTKIRDNNNV